MQKKYSLLAKASERGGYCIEAYPSTMQLVSDPSY